MTRLVVSRRATSDLLAIWDYIALDNEQAASRLVAAIDEKFVLLRELPEMGVPRPDVHPEFRALVHGAYLILYEFHPGDDLVEIVAVLHGMRDLPEAL